MYTAYTTSLSSMTHTQTHIQMNQPQNVVVVMVYK